MRLPDVIARIGAGCKGDKSVAPLKRFQVRVVVAEVGLNVLETVPRRELLRRGLSKVNAHDVEASFKSLLDDCTSD